MTQKQYDAARRVLVKTLIGDEKAMRVVECGAVEHGKDAMRKRFVSELKSKGWKELAEYLNRLLRDV